MQTLKQARISKGITKVAMARQLGISPRTYYVYEKHPGRMRVEMAKKASEILDQNISDIFFS
ncbi:MAG: helix-turn-helix transcriptional regulator [Collinsella sp.]|nr:helix-turn-helix transcriptional regulator [Collinsella sp.]MDY5560894.1 helix-turn-helix transcriptional regulator [Collinsella sp.]